MYSQFLCSFSWRCFSDFFSSLPPLSLFSSEGKWIKSTHTSTLPTPRMHDDVNVFVRQQCYKNERRRTSSNYNKTDSSSYCVRLDDGEGEAKKKSTKKSSPHSVSAGCLSVPFYSYGITAWVINSAACKRWVCVHIEENLRVYTCLVRRQSLHVYIDIRTKRKCMHADVCIHVCMP